MWTLIWFITAMISAIIYKKSEKTCIIIISLLVFYLAVVFAVLSSVHTSRMEYNTKQYVHKTETKTIIKNDSIIKADTFHVIIPIKKNK